MTRRTMMTRDSIISTASSIVGSVFVLVSSACCIGPLAVILSFVGLSSSTLLAVENTFGPFRPYIFGLTVLFLSGGFYFAYREESEDCKPDQICAHPHSRRIQRFLLWIATSLFVVLLYFTYVHPNLDLYFGIY
ncbi:hypothetical protein L0222_05700 [bacterium]|nr:hypothetical protein [bacterium]